MDFKQLKTALTDEQLKIREHARANALKCEWDDPVDTAHYRSQMSREQRERVIRSNAPDHRCPSCTRLVINPRNWVLAKNDGMVICASCYTRVRAEIRKETDGKATFVDRLPAQVKIFPHVEKRYTIDCNLLVLSREHCQMTASQFAEEAGWHRSYQNLLERGGQTTVNEATIRTILTVLQKFGLDTMDSLE